MLSECSVEVRARAADIDDGLLTPGDVSPKAWVGALAYLKARRVADELAAERAEGTVLGADTVCVADERIHGQPASANEAHAMVQMMCGRAHEVVTGVCAIDLATSKRWILIDSAIVTWGDVADDDITRYVESGGWRGKAGAYNLEERMRAGWPIDCRGDASTVMGLPMDRLRSWLESPGA